jgi:hypothetical protein
MRIWPKGGVFGSSGEYWKKGGAFQRDAATVATVAIAPAVAPALAVVAAAQSSVVRGKIEPVLKNGIHEVKRELFERMPKNAKHYTDSVVGAVKDPRKIGKEVPKIRETTKAFVKGTVRGGLLGEYSPCQGVVCKHMLIGDCLLGQVVLSLPTTRTRNRTAARVDGSSPTFTRTG